MRIFHPIKDGKPDPIYPVALVVDQRSSHYWKIFAPVDPGNPMRRWAGNNPKYGQDCYQYQITEIMGGRPLPEYEYFSTKWPDAMLLDHMTLSPIHRAYAIIFFHTMGELLYFRTKLR